jgi:hypothetical protein
MEIIKYIRKNILGKKSLRERGKEIKKAHGEVLRIMNLIGFAEKNNDLSALYKELSTLGMYLNEVDISLPAAEMGRSSDSSHITGADQREYSLTRDISTSLVKIEEIKIRLNQMREKMQTVHGML